MEVKAAAAAVAAAAAASPMGNHPRCYNASFFLFAKF